MRRQKTIAPLEVYVGDDLEKALKILKRKMAYEGIYKELKKRRHFSPPSVQKRLKREEAERRRRKNLKRKVNRS